MPLRATSLVLLGTCLIAGCGSGGAPAGTSSPEPTVTSEAELKTRLQYIADSGQAGSGLAGLPEAIGKVSDSAKRDALMAEYAKLEKAGSPTAIKKIAADMLAKLP